MPTTGCGDTSGLATPPQICETSEPLRVQSLDRPQRLEGGKMQSGVKTLSAGGGASLCCLLLLWLIYSHLLREGTDTCLLLTFFFFFFWGGGIG
ncbi:unnamed protein product [Tetraodon nigroviridis]|uniref:(spotted green pufferfish) hypothetical protein n=1 Tax=Tetraodon nigroviridis TaxID=99883 RepID=Q4SCB2_TETNG|nr:unnamed protein product [Tetraodon nigroviridis]